MSEPVWRKSSRSGSGAGGGQDCVEVASLTDTFLIRDSKTPDAGHLALTPEYFARLVARAKRGDLNL